MSKWKDYRIKDICCDIGSGTTPKSTNARFYDNGTYCWLNTGDLNDALVFQSSQHITDAALAAYPSLKKYPKDTIIVAMYGATIGKVGLLTFDSYVNQACCAMVINKTIANPLFVLYYLLTYKPQLVKESFGGTQPNVNQFKVATIRIAIPPLEEQGRIVSYLNDKTGKIDARVSLLSKKRDAYQRLKKALISRVVTKGLNPNAKFKPSGVDWIGEIPEGWEVKRIKEICDFVSRGTTPDYVDESKYKVMNQATFSKGYIDDSIVRYTCKPSADANIKMGDLLIASTGGGVLGKVLYYNREDKFFYADSHVSILRNSKGENCMKFLYYVFSTKFAEINATMVKGSTNQTELQRNYLLAHEIPIPAKAEQQSIATYLDEKCSEIDANIANLEKQIEKYKELKRALISEVVTGKRRV